MARHCEEPQGDAAIRHGRPERSEGIKRLLRYARKDVVCRARKDLPPVIARRRRRRGNRKDFGPVIARSRRLSTVIARRRRRRGNRKDLPPQDAQLHPSIHRLAA